MRKAYDQAMWNFLLPPGDLLPLLLRQMKRKEDSRRKNEGMSDKKKGNKVLYLNRAPEAARFSAELNNPDREESDE